MDEVDQTDVRETDKLQYFAITEFHNYFIIRSPSLFFNEYLREAKRSTISTKERSQEGEKRGRILFVAKQSWTTLRVSSRPLFVRSYFQVTWWALGQ